MKHPHTDTFETRARELYLRAGPRIDPTTAARLRAARRQALERNPHHGWRWMMPAGACAVALLAAVVVWQPLQRPATLATMAPTATIQADATQALPPDADRTDPTLYKNLGFYAWLAQHPDNGHNTVPGR